MMGYRFMARLRRYYTCIGRSLRRRMDGGGGMERDVSSIETYMVFGLEKTGEFGKGCVGGRRE